MINGQYWKLHMIVLFRSSWYKYHTRFRFYRVNFCYWYLHFFKSFYGYTSHVIVWMRSFDNRNHDFNLLVPRQYREYFAKFYAYPDSLMRCYARLGRRHCDVTGHLACPQRPYGAFAAMLRRPVSAATSLRLFWACSKLGGDLGDLTAICSAATALCEISQRPCGDQRRSCRFCRSQRGRRPVWLGYK